MKKELVDKAWHSLPIEYKEKVAFNYMAVMEHDDGSSHMREQMNLLRYLFGEDNMMNEIKTLVR